MQAEQVPALRSWQKTLSSANPRGTRHTGSGVRKTWAPFPVLQLANSDRGNISKPLTPVSATEKKWWQYCQKIQYLNNPHFKVPRAYLTGREGLDPSRWTNDWQLLLLPGDGAQPPVRSTFVPALEEGLTWPLFANNITQKQSKVFPLRFPSIKLKEGFFCLGFFSFGQPWGCFFPLDVGKMFLTFRVREIKNGLRKTVSEEVIRFHTLSQNIREVWRRCRWGGTWRPGMLAGGSRRAWAKCAWSQGKVCSYFSENSSGIQILKLNFLWFSF